MKFIKYILAALIITFGVSLIPANAQTISGNDNIEHQVFRKILTLPYYGIFDTITFKVDGSTVHLYGKVYSLGLKDTAARSVSKIKGVQNVVNNIEMLPPSPFDDSIRRKVVRTFVRNGGSLSRYLNEPQPSVRIIVDRGRVSLEGFVSSRGDFDLATILVKGVSGVFNVENNLIVDKERVR